MSYPPFNPQGIGTLNETARNMFRQQPLNMPYGPAQQLAYQQPQFGMGGMQQGNGINQYGQYLEQTYGDPEFDQKRDTFLQDVQQQERQTFGGGGGSFGFPAMLSNEGYGLDPSYTPRDRFFGLEKAQIAEGGLLPNEMQLFASGGEAMGPPPTRGPDPQGIGYFQQFADGGPVYMQEGGDPFAEVDFDKLTAAVIQTESAGDPNAVSEDDAIGLMQVLPSTGAQPGYEKLGAQNVFDIAIDLGFPIDDSERTVEKARELLFEPEINVAFGTKYLRAMIAHSGGDIKQALQKYNAGTGNYQAFVEGRKPLDQEAVRYPVLVANALTGGNLAMPEASSFTPTPVQRGEDLIMSMPVAQSDAMSLLAIENRREGTEFQGQDAYSAGENLSRQTRQDFGSQAQQDDFEIEEEEQESIMEKYSPESMGEQLKGGQGSVPPQRAPMLDTIEEFFNKFKPPKKPPFTVYPKLTDPLA